MSLHFFSDFASDAVVRALGWTLLHTLWQAAVVALLLAVLTRFLRRARASTRYGLSAGALLLVPVLAAVTFGLAYEPVAETGPRLTVMTLAAEPSFAALTPTAPTPITPSLTEAAELTVRAAAARLEPWLPLLVAAWTLGLALMLIRLGGGLVVVRRLRRVGVAAVPAAWQARTAALAERLNVRQSVMLLESASVRGPVAVGWLKPVVLLPVGLVAGLPAAQLEAVLAHELAHIRRHDYVLNLLQAVVEAGFFFHPAIWWMSALVRQEREHCCDDLAVRALGGDARPLARALAALAAWESAAVETPAALPRLTLAATGGALLTRVRRLLVPSAAAAARPAGGALAGGGAVALTLLLVLTLSALLRVPLPVQAAVPTEPDFSEAPEMIMEEPPVMGIPADSTKNKRAKVRIERRSSSTTTSTSNDDGDSPSLILVKDKKNRLREVYVDGKKVPADRVAEYQPYVDEALSEQKENRREPVTEQDLAAARETLKDAQRSANRAEREIDRRANREIIRRGNRDVQIHIDGPRAEVNGKVINIDSIEAKIGSTIEEAFAGIDFHNFNFSVNDDEGGSVQFESRCPTPPVPPIPPTPPTPATPPTPPAPPTPPTPPTAPRAPKTGDAKSRQQYDQRMSAYDKQMQAYSKRMAAYGQQMEAYGRKMEEYGRQQQQQAAAPVAPGRFRQIGPRRNSRTSTAAPNTREWQQAQREAQQDRAEALRDAAQDREEALRDAQQERDEALREANRERTEALRQAAEDRREAARDRAQAQRDAAQARRDAQQAARDEQRAGQLGDALRQDGLIGANDRSYSVGFENGNLTVNDKPVPDNLRPKYEKLLGVPADSKGTTMRIQVND